jgi:hypothetical protein
VGRIDWSRSEAKRSPRADKRSPSLVLFSSKIRLRCTRLDSRSFHPISEDKWLTSVVNFSG